MLYLDITPITATIVSLTSTALVMSLIIRDKVPLGDMLKHTPSPKLPKQ